VFLTVARVHFKFVVMDASETQCRGARQFRLLNTSIKLAGISHSADTVMVRPLSGRFNSIK